MISLHRKKTDGHEKNGKAKAPSHEEVVDSEVSALNQKDESIQRRISDMESVLSQKEILLDEMEDRLKEVENAVFEAEKESPVSTMVTDMASKLETLSLKTTEIENDLSSQKKVLESGLKGSYIGKAIESNADLARVMLEKLKEVSQKMFMISRRLELDELKMNFSETLNTLATTQNESRISTLVSDLRGFIVELKRNSMWNTNLEEVTESLLGEIAEMWKSYGYPHLADLFTSEAQRIKAEM